MSVDHREAQVRAGAGDGPHACPTSGPRGARETAITSFAACPVPERRRPRPCFYPVDGIRRHLVAQPAGRPAMESPGGGTGQESAPRGPAGPRPIGPSRPSGPGRLQAQPGSARFHTQPPPRTTPLPRHTAPPFYRGPATPRPRRRPHAAHSPAVNRPPDGRHRRSQQTNRLIELPGAAPGCAVEGVPCRSTRGDGRG